MATPEVAVPAAEAPQTPRQAPPLQQAAAGEFHLQAEAAQPGEAAEAPASADAGSTDFWDGFYAEREGAASGVATQTDTAPDPGAFRLADEVDDEGPAADTSGLFTDEDVDDETDYAPAFSTQEDRGWSYDDPVKEEAEDHPPAVSSPEPDREDLVVAESRLQRITGWRPRLPSFGGFGASDLGMRAREAFSLLDAVLEENDTDDIPKGLLVGLGAFAIFLGAVAVLIVLFS